MNSITSEFVTEFSEAPRVAPGEKADGGFAARYPLRILIAEDNYINRRLLLLLLRNLGYEAVATENGRECLEAVLTESYDIVLSDIDMPEMNGIECTAQIRRAGLDLPIIAVTASFPELTREQCLDSGMNGYMTKPVNVTEIKRVLREAALRKWMESANRVALGV
jgi:CheY-like chemotaxis protein